VFENRYLRKILGAKRDEVTGEWRKLHNEELYILYSSPNIIRQIKSKRMRCARHVASMGRESIPGFNEKARRKETHLEDQGVYGRMGSGWILGGLAGGGECRVDQVG
jgi:hypothetical protein